MNPLNNTTAKKKLIEAIYPHCSVADNGMLNVDFALESLEREISKGKFSATFQIMNANGGLNTYDIQLIVLKGFELTKLPHVNDITHNYVISVKL
jgi:hypothetical protein